MDKDGRMAIYAFQYMGATISNRRGTTMNTKKQSKAVKRLYAKQRHSKKQAKAATRQGGYWRDIPAEVNPQYKERRIVEPTLRLADGSQVWVRPDGKELVQQDYRVTETVTDIVKSWKYDRQAEKSVAEKERALVYQSFILGDCPAVSLRSVTLYKQAATSWLKYRLTSEHGGNKAAAMAELSRTKRLVKQWAGIDKPSTLLLALAICHGIETALRITERIDSTVKSLRYIDDGSNRIDTNTGYTAARAAMHRADRTDDGDSYSHCREVDNTIYGLLSFFSAALRR